MALRFRQTFTLFPGVRINIGKTGISTSIGVRGATVNIGQHGVRATIGAPGTGASYSALVFPFGQGEREQCSLPSRPAPTVFTPLSPWAHPAGNTPLTAKAYMPQAGMKEIASASVEVLTSTSLAPMRDLIVRAREQQAQVRIDLKEAHEEDTKPQTELGRRTRSIFRWFYRWRILELETLIPATKDEVARLSNWDDNTKIAVTFSESDAAQRAYSSLVRAFEVLRSCSKKWDVTADRSPNQFVERTVANRTVDRHTVAFEFSSTDLIQFSGRAMRFENVNGDDILIYPGVALMPRPDGIFALIDIRELNIVVERTGFHETDGVPKDAKVIGQTWAKTNKDGSQDRRFRENYQIPVCEYGLFTFKSKTGVAEEYMISNADAGFAFAEALKAYQKALAEAD